MANPFAPAQIDFSMLAKLPEIWNQGAKTAQENRTRHLFDKGLPTGPDGATDWDAVISAITKNDPEIGAKLQTAGGSADQYGTVVPIQGPDGQWGVGAIPRKGNDLKIMGMGGYSAPPQTRNVDDGNVNRSVTVRGAQPIGEPSLKSGTPPPGYQPNAASTPGGPITYEGMPGTPESRTQPSVGKANISSAIGRLGTEYSNLYNAGGIGSPDKSTLGNIGSYLSNSGAGQEVGKAVGSKTQSIRNTINSNVPLVIASIKNSAGLSAQQLNSNAELQFYMNSATNPQTNDVFSQLTALDALDSTYGQGDALKNSLPKAMYDRIHAASQAQLAQHPLPPPDGAGDPQNTSPYPEAGPRPSSGDMDALRQHSDNPQFRAEFEKIYGAGSVDRWLGNSGWTSR